MTPQIARMQHRAVMPVKTENSFTSLQPPHLQMVKVQGRHAEDPLAGVSLK